MTKEYSQKGSSSQGSSSSSRKSSSRGCNSFYRLQANSLGACCSSVTQPVGQHRGGGDADRQCRQTDADSGLGGAARHGALGRSIDAIQTGTSTSTALDRLNLSSPERNSRPFFFLTQPIGQHCGDAGRQMQIVALQALLTHLRLPAASWIDTPGLCVCISHNGYGATSYNAVGGAGEPGWVVVVVGFLRG